MQSNAAQLTKQLRYSSAVVTVIFQTSYSAADTVDTQLIQQQRRHSFLFMT